MNEIDSQLKTVLKKIYNDIEKNDGEVSVSAPIYKQTQIDALVMRGLIKKIDASTFSGWAYILRPTYEGESLLNDEKNHLRIKIEEFIKSGEEMCATESHTTGRSYHAPSVSDPLYDVWMGEINIFNERHLKEHPLYGSIHTTYFHRQNKASSYCDMMGHLRALFADDEFWGLTNSIVKDKMNMMKNSISQMLSEDIKRCKDFLDKPEDESVGIDIYVDITGRYDSVIPNFGNGLYQYIAESHFYDPEISGETLIFNLKKLMNRMISYFAMNYPTVEISENRIVDGSNVEYGGSSKPMSNKIFIVHGHDNEAVQEMARTLEKMGFQAIILHEQPDVGLTIIEKIERYSDVDFAVVLYTECDLGRAKECPKEAERYRARQNVVFEHGYLLAKLGRDHVCALVKGDLETPGDINGVVYVQMDHAGAWKMQLGKNLKEVGMKFDMNKLFC